MEKNKKAYTVFAWAALCLLAFTFIFPLYWIVTGSFKLQTATVQLPPQWFPAEPTAANYVKLFKNPAGLWLWNSVFQAAMATLLTCFTASLAGYALAKKRFTGAKFIFAIFVCAMALPKQVVMVPLVRIMAAIGLYNTSWAVIFPTVGWPFGVFLMKQFSETLPSELLEAARIDGAGELRTFWDIVLPIVKPGVGALAIFTFVNTWNDYFMQLIMLKSSDAITVSLGIARLQSEFATHWARYPSLQYSSASRSILRRASPWAPSRDDGRLHISGGGELFALCRPIERGTICMREPEKYCGVIPAFYACYDDAGEVSPERVRALAEHLIRKGVKGVYVGGSSGECIYQSVDDRKRTLENVMAVAKGRITVIAHVACNNTRDSVELARHAESLGVDAIAAIPPIYFHLPEYAIADYWNAMSNAAPNTDFVIYNIPQLAGVALTMPLFEEMRKNPRVAAVKNSSMPVQDIQMFKAAGGEGFVVFNGPDEQFVGGRTMGADGGIGGTYAVMPELYLAMNEHINKGEIEAARAIQYDADRIIYKMCEAHGNLYAVQKEILRRMYGLELGGVREPMPGLIPEDEPIVAEAQAMIEAAIAKL